MKSNLIILSCMSCFVTVIFILSLKKIARNIGLVDKANDRKLHDGDIPLIGGISIFLGFTFSLLLSPIGLGEYRALFAASIIIVIIGFLDDMHELSSTTKTIVEISLILICIFWGGVRLNTLGDIFFIGSIHLGALTVIFTIIAMFGIINSINMLDGSDGVAGLTAIIQLTYLSIIAYSSELWNSFYLIVLLSTAICGFLIFNLPKLNNKQKSNLVFLGDSGSLFIGLFLVWFTISLSQHPQTSVTPVVMLWIMALPIYDTISVIIQRLLKKASPFEAKRDHFHHCFNRKRPVKIVYYVTILNILFGAIGLFLKSFEIQGGYSLGIFLLLFIIFLTWKLKSKH